MTRYSEGVEALVQALHQAFAEKDRTRYASIGQALRVSAPSCDRNLTQ
ncbi:MAG: hypothetical protein AAFX06_17455 [Planctomycetota bacterium]